MSAPLDFGKNKVATMPVQRTAGNVSMIASTTPGAEVFKEPDNFDPGLEAPPMDMFPGWAKRMAEMQIIA